MPSITYIGPGEISPPVLIGPASLLAFPCKKEVEATPEVAALVKQLYPGDDLFIVTEPQAAPTQKK